MNQGLCEHYWVSIEQLLYVLSVIVLQTVYTRTWYLTNIELVYYKNFSLSLP